MFPVIPGALVHLQKWKVRHPRWHRLSSRVYGCQQPREGVEEEEDKGHFFPVLQSRVFCVLAPQFRVTAAKPVSFSLRCPFTSVSSGRSGTEWKSLPAARVPKWVKGGRGDHSLDGQLCREIPAAGASCKEMYSKAESKWKTLRKQPRVQSENPEFLNILV